MIKLFCSDFDNTCAYRGRLLRQNVVAIQRLQAEGVTFALVSGRHLSNCQKKLDSRKIQCPVVASNGALTVDVHDQILCGRYIPAGTSAELYSYSVKNHCFFLAYSQDSVYMPWNYRWVGKIPPVNWVAYGLSRTKIRSFPKPESGKTLPRIYKFSIYPEKKELWKTRNFFVQMKEVHAVWSDEKKVEIQAAGVNKMTGIQSLIDSMGLRREEVAAIGDQNNDLAMIEGAGLGLAVGNAVEGAKAKADRVFASVRQGGFSQAVDYVLSLNAEEKSKN